MLQAAAYIQEKQWQPSPDSAPQGSRTLTQMPQPMQSSSEIQAICEAGVASTHSLPTLTTGQNFLHSCRHFLGLHLCAPQSQPCWQAGLRRQGDAHLSPLTMATLVRDSSPSELPWLAFFLGAMAQRPGVLPGPALPCPHAQSSGAAACGCAPAAWQSLPAAPPRERRRCSEWSGAAWEPKISVSAWGDSAWETTPVLVMPCRSR